MKFKHSYLLILIFLIFSCTEKNTPAKISASNALNIAKAKNVIIVVIDGPRYSETWGDPSHQYIPHMANDMAGEGVIFTNFLNDGFTYTNSGHTAITTGFRQEIKNTGEIEYPKYPSFFQYYLKQKGKQKSSAWLITSKGKLQNLANTTHPEWNDAFLPSTNCGTDGKGNGYRNDFSTFNEIVRILKTNHPNIVLINFKEPDGAGHANDWQGYLQGIRDTDKYAWDLWKLIKTDSFYKDQTAFFVTNDHGRHLDSVADGFVSHGCNCEGCRHINLYAYGPDFKKNTVVNDKYAQQDLSATVAYLMNLQMPYSEGKNIKALFLE
jgi:hypothetical protein